MEEISSNVTDTALIFEGGGMRASYTSAVVVALLNAGIHMNYVAGISAGASNTANYVARDPKRARTSFVEFADDPNMGGWGTFLRGKGMFHAEYIYEGTSLPDQALPYDFATFTKNPAEIRIGAFRASDGESVYFTKHDIRTMRDLMVRVRASSSMPILMPPVDIDGELYWDGALGPCGGIPLDVAKRDGYDKFFVVLTRTRDYVKKQVKLPAAYRAYFRKYPAVAEAILARWHRYNAVREELFQLERDGKAILFVPESMQVSNGERSVAKLSAAHLAGLRQAHRELPMWREFLGL